MTPRRRRWPFVLIGLLVVIGGLWSVAWHYASAKVERTVEGWKQREARSGRVYTCGSQTIGGFPFAIEVRCADVSAELTSSRPALSLKAKDLLVSAQVWRPTVLTSTLIGPLTITQPGEAATTVARWKQAITTVHGLPTAPERIETVIDAPVVERSSGGNNERVFAATRMVIQGRMIEGSARLNPVIEVALKMTAGVAPSLHPAMANPLDADVTAMLRGLKDFSPKPWPVRFQEIQAAGGRIEITNARLQQGETIAASQGALGLSPRGRLDGQLRLTVAGLDKLLPALGIDKMMAQQQASRDNRMGAAIGALDRLAPGLGNVARQQAGPALIVGLNFIGQPAEIEGKRGVTLPLRFSDGAVSLGPIPLGQLAPLY